MEITADQFSSGSGPIRNKIYNKANNFWKVREWSSPWNHFLSNNTFSENSFRKMESIIFTKDFFSQVKVMYEDRCDGCLKYYKYKKIERSVNGINMEFVFHFWILFYSLKIFFLRIFSPKIIQSYFPGVPANYYRSN